MQGRIEDQVSCQGCTIRYYYKERLLLLCHQIPHRTHDGTGGQDYCHLHHIVVCLYTDKRNIRIPAPKRQAAVSALQGGVGQGRQAPPVRPSCQSWLVGTPLADASRRNRLGLRYETCAEGNGDDAGLPSTPHRFVGRNDNEDHHFRGQSHRSFAACDRLPALFPPQAEIG